MHDGCLRTRKRGLHHQQLFSGSHVLRSTSPTQVVSFLEFGSGESEVYSVVQGTSAGLGAEVRKGAGRIRHIATPTPMVTFMEFEPELRCVLKC